MKVRHKTNGMVVQVPDELATWTPDRKQPDPKLVAAGKKQPIPWFKWAVWEQVPDSTPVTHPAPEAKPAAAKGKSE